MKETVHLIVDPNTRKAGKIKIKEEGRIEGKKGIWEQISQK